MKILVYDVAAEDGGGLFVLKNFYEDVIKLQDNENQWFFLVSTDEVQTVRNIKVIRNTKIKTSYAHRIVFELLELPKLLRKIQPDLIISLQNAPIGHCKVRQFVYLHQSLQYCPKKFSFLKSDERRTAFRQHIICNFYKKELPKSEHIFVQTEWIKNATIEWIHYPSNKITVVPVSLDDSIFPIEKYVGQKSRVFFYPARAEMYKNHEVVIDACRILKKAGYTDFKVLFTIKKEDGEYACRLVEKSRGLPIEFIGTITYENVWKYYSQSILLFPSYLETCGLPMLEAKIANCRILASDMPFSHEALDGYVNASFFKYNDATDLSNAMKSLLDNPKHEFADINRSHSSKSLVKAILERI